MYRLSHAFFPLFCRLACDEVEGSKARDGSIEVKRSEVRAVPARTAVLTTYRSGDYDHTRINGRDIHIEV
jgi:hypothetical protein